MSGVPFQMADNLASIFDSGPTRAAPARGRRAAQAQDIDESIVPGETSSEVPISLSGTRLNDEKQSFSDVPRVERPGRRRQMWGVGGQEETVVEDFRFLVDNKEELLSDGEDIPIIPELEELENDQPTADEIAAPPSAMFTELLSYHELDSHLLRQSAFQILDNEIDLKILARTMDLQSELVEEDETWNMEKLFVDMQSTVTCCNKNIIGQEIEGVAVSKNDIDDTVSREVLI
uniref:intraflagellar transport protein 43 homolog n=1 Tax=Styela clava TaxID=7725 RepID=UPI00193A0499|nr:intraflagellar transport protein 43 homolog [Styela clava]